MTPSNLWGSGGICGAEADLWGRVGGICGAGGNLWGRQLSLLLEPHKEKGGGWEFREGIYGAEADLWGRRESMGQSAFTSHRAS